MGDVTLPVGSAVLWFTFPDAPYEVAACYDPDAWPTIVPIISFVHREEP